MRALCLLKLEKYKEAAHDAAKALELGANFDANLVYGKALFFLGKFLEAKKAFAEGKEKAGPELSTFNQFDQWIDWSEDRIKRIARKEAKTTCKEMNGHSDEKTEKTEESNPPAANVMPAPKIKHDWYQTETHVVITILIKNQKAEDVKVNFTEKTVSVTAPLPSGSEYSLELDVCHRINPELSSFKVVPSKIEVKMKKVDGIHWAALEGDGTEPTVKSAPGEPTKPQSVPAYPSSASRKHDWNKLEADIKAEEENEKLEGDAALNQLFQKIYGQGSDETKRAMNKSFMESGGTVLSTNWKEVATDKVDVKPPDGMEYKKWN
ncbi:protein SGT1 homolog [Palaemon carinicauda]|uniref:protein SGT1 homolog n=1 Tax=Palaemon carinicauda TaxID=392227 RepID=UPI0035B5B50A